jgi:F-type H+-transporting ATPase subunit a
LAVIVLVYYVIAGIIKKKHKFLLHEISFVGIISMLVEILELVTRPLTLALRLFGNILAGEILITALLGLIAWGLPLPIMFFEILVACVQALVFTMLTTVYIATAVNENH